jgi:glycosyltransferase involved in cell wall biosynthesis
MISIITPVYNGARFIESCILNILELQITHQHIIVDGGSTDGTLEIIKNYPHVLLINQKEKSGMYGAIDIGFKNAQYDYITWINCDDKVVPKAYQNAVEFAYTKSLDFVYGNGSFYLEKINIYKHHKANRYGQYFLRKGILPFLQPSSFYRKCIYDDIQINFKYFKICGDLDFFMRIAILNKYNIHYMNANLTIFLKYGESLGDRSHKLYLQERQNLLTKPTTWVRILFKISNFL